MKSRALILLLTLLLILTTGISLVSADPTDPPEDRKEDTKPGWGCGMGAGRWLGNGIGPGVGSIRDYVTAELAAGLGLSLDDFTARREAGETFGDLAQAQGLTFAQAQSLVVNARNVAIDNALADGAITEKQANRMRRQTEKLLGHPGKGKKLGQDRATCGW
jgi:hypothetical protein